MRPEKPTIIEDLKSNLQGSPFAIIADYTGMTVVHFEELRSRLAGVGASCHVTKNSFLKRAFTDLDLPDLNGVLTGQNALVTGESDVCAAAKVLKKFESEFSRPGVKGGVLDNDVLSPEQVASLASLPAKEVLQAQLLGLLTTPATRLVRTLNEPGASLARLLNAKAEKEGTTE